MTIIDASVSAAGRLRRGLARAIKLADGPNDNATGLVTRPTGFGTNRPCGDPTAAAPTRAGHPAGVAAPEADLIATILAAADERDAIADARDAAADLRERELDLAEMLDVDGAYGDHLAQRREASLDRLQAREDRAAARRDRIALVRVQAVEASHSEAGVC